MALPDLTGQNIEDTYQRLVHTDGADNYFTGDGTSIDLGATDISALNTFTGSAETSLTALNSFTGSYTFLSSSQQIADDISGSFQGQSVISSSMTSSLFVSHSLSSSLSTVTEQVRVNDAFSAGAFPILFGSAQSDSSVFKDPDALDLHYSYTQKRFYTTNIVASSQITASKIKATSEVSSSYIRSSGDIYAAGTITGNVLTVNNITFTEASTITVQTPDEDGSGAGGNITIEAGDGGGSNGTGGDLTFNAGRGQGGGESGDITFNTFGRISNTNQTLSGSFVVNSNKFSIAASGDVTSSGTISASSGFIGDLTGTSSFATSASYAATASKADTLKLFSATSGDFKVVLGSGANYQQLRYDASDGLTFNASTDKLTVGGDVAVGSDLSVTGGLILSQTGSLFLGTRNHLALSKDSFAGDSVEFGNHYTSNGNLVAGRVYSYYNGSWYEYTPDSTNSIDRRTGLLGVCMEDDYPRFLIRGQVRTQNQNTSAFTSGDIIYGDNSSAGRITNAAQSASGDIVRILGYSITPSTGEFWFDPDKTWVET